MITSVPNKPVPWQKKKQKHCHQKLQNHAFRAAFQQHHFHFREYVLTKTAFSHWITLNIFKLEKGEMTKCGFLHPQVEPMLRLKNKVVVNVAFRFMILIKK